MENKMLISVIIPVYNAEKYIRRAVESVLGQMNGQVELILVDDGSADNSGAICDEYGRSNSQVQVIHKVNGGPCTARNAGIAAATGEYIMFLDSDDYLAPTACDEIMKVIQQHKPDCIDFGWNYVSWNGEITENMHKIPKNVLLGNDVVRNMILPPLLHLCKDDEHFVYDFACVKVFRRQIIVEHSVFFDEGRRTWEDRFFVIQYLKHCRNYYSMDRCLYYYVFVEGSLSQRYSMDFFRIILVSFQQYLLMYADEFDFNTQYVNNHWCGAIESMIYRSLEQTQNRDAIKQNILNTLREEQVVHWYANRRPQDAFEEKVNALVVAGEAEAALRAYEKKAAQKRRKKRVLDIKNRIKSVIRKMIGR